MATGLVEVNKEYSDAGGALHQTGLRNNIVRFDAPIRLRAFYSVRISFRSDDEINRDALGECQIAFVLG
jgi:hypothetical protein